MARAPPRECPALGGSLELVSARQQGSKALPTCQGLDMTFRGSLAVMAGPLGELMGARTGLQVSVPPAVCEPAV